MLVKDLPENDLTVLSEAFKRYLKNDKADFMDCWGNLSVSYMREVFYNERGTEMYALVSRIKTTKEAK